ncbi:hypothetical protein [Methylocaldum szegediense]|uniref:G8 domain-containing protein n=1 Tax=Methylocaldum szegediense TaxID=73780 RepID=A0ABM9I0L7_9GAMM|nr:hypothetical protein [Methylocaldum szegediense]CAI8809209.1 conserved exported protein of unknown function [Methylocaldum szegediense]
MQLVPIIFAVTLSLFLPIHAQADRATPGPIGWVGGADENWFNPANWSTGRVPGPEDDVLLDADDKVVIDPSLGPMPVQIRDLTIRGRARLETLPGSHLITRDELVQDHGQDIGRSNATEGDTLVISTAATPMSRRADKGSSNLILNPKSISRRDLILKTGATVTLGLGGREPASLRRSDAGVEIRSGEGHYATLTADLVVLNSEPGADRPAPAIRKLPPGLLLTLHYGFRPVDGDRFQIITVNRLLVDHFRYLPEGALVGCTDDNVGLYISYVGGDGNDVVLYARNTPYARCLSLPAIQKVRDVADASTHIRPPPPKLPVDAPKPDSWR